jgi:anti-sigma regulatory factor (Ser/Thr protein kinase)
MAQLADDAALAVSELATNALQASWSASLVLPVLMRLRADDETLIAKLWDAAPAPPEPRPHAIDAQGGRGLEIVSLLSETWGYYLENGGKVVWALLHAEASHHYRERPRCPGRQLSARPRRLQPEPE